MRLRLPKLRAGQRKFLVEVGVVVFGVLIALGAEQLVGQINTNQDVAEARAAIRAEIRAATGDIRARLALSGCITRRASELESRLQQYRNGNAFTPIAAIGRPMSTPPISQAWETLKASPAAMHLPTEERLAYGALYAGFAMLRDVQGTERETWLQLQDFEGAPDLDPASAMRLRGLISRARIANEAMDRMGATAMERATDLGVEIGTRAPVENGSLCRPLP